ncbi:MAG: hypothetical protein KTR20_13695 [Cellvibrionaceae bacterium]|nr:hypothetical protein [Cellvibrionaceae bacterium]
MPDNMLENTADGLVNIDDHGLLLIRGLEAKKFLQGQVTCDIEQLTSTAEATHTGISSLGAHCTPKGRMLFSFRVCQWDADTLALSIYRQLLPAALQALKKYSIFSKVELIDASADYQLTGITDTALDRYKAHFPTLPTTPNQVVQTASGVIIAITEKRFEIWQTRAQAAALLANIPITANAAQWTQYQIDDGLGEVQPATVELFIPQMLNFQHIGTAISFKKGCYTGQEVIARMTYLGKLKRRLYRFAYPAGTQLKVGDPLYTHGDDRNPQQSIGHIVLHSSVDHDHRLLAVATEDAVEKDSVYLDTQGRLKLQMLPLPYAITKE